ncbi:MAG: hypothetical protein ACRYFZ_05690 [Janthinobacterium lividum]
MEAPVQKNFLYDTLLPKVELINWLVVGAGLVLRCFFLRSGGNTLLTVGLEGLAIVYLLRAFEPSTIDVPANFAFNDATSMLPLSDGFISLLARQLLAFGSALTFLGILFKLLFWTGSAVMFPAGIGMLLLVIAWQSSVGSLARQTVLIAGLGVIAWTIPTDTLAQYLFRNDPILAEKLIFQHNHPHDRVAAQEVQQLMWIWKRRTR